VKEGGRFGGEGKQRWVWRLRLAMPDDGDVDTERLKVLKNSEHAQQKNVSTFKNSGHLQGNSAASAPLLGDAQADTVGYL